MTLLAQACGPSRGCKSRYSPEATGEKATKTEAEGAGGAGRHDALGQRRSAWVQRLRDSRAAPYQESQLRWQEHGAMDSDRQGNVSPQHCHLPALEPGLFESQPFLQI